jgi:hypothetical protein
MSKQLDLFSGSKADVIDDGAVDPWTDPATEANAVDEMFATHSRYRSGHEYVQLLNFIAGLPQYSAFNGFLLHAQRPTITHVATARTWARRHSRHLKPNARPLMILAPMGPVRFLYDLSDTEGEPVSTERLKPYAVIQKLNTRVYENIKHNCALHGIVVRDVASNDRRRGAAMRMTPSVRKMHRHLNLTKDTSYLVTLDPADAPESKFSRLALELGHIFCGHLGIDKGAWWPERHHINATQEQLEAESVAFLVCRRKGLTEPARKYLQPYQTTEQQIPVLSLNAILQAVNYIEEMGRSRWGKPKKRSRY